MNNLKNWAMRGFMAGLISAAFFVLAQVASNTTFAQLPSTSPGGTLNLLSDGCMFGYNVDSHGTRTWYPTASCTPLSYLGPASGWTFYTAGSATLSDQGNSMVMQDTSSTGALSVMLKAVPSAPYTKTFAVKLAAIQAGASDETLCGVALTNGTASSSSYQQLRIYPLTSSGGGVYLQIVHATSFAGAGATQDAAMQSGIGWAGSGVIFFEIIDDNTSRYYKISADGQNYMQVYSVSRTSLFTPTDYGFGCSSSTTGNKWVADILGGS